MAGGARRIKHHAGQRVPLLRILLQYRMALHPATVRHGAVHALKVQLPVKYVLARSVRPHLPAGATAALHRHQHLAIGCNLQAALCHTATATAGQRHALVMARQIGQAGGPVSSGSMCR